MITLQKFSPDHPDHGHAIAWLNQRRKAYRKARRAGTNVDRFLDNYRDKRVKSALVDETWKKCAYCESLYRAVAFGDVEHLLPKARDPERLLDYENLTVSCSVCNNLKSDYEDPEMPLLNPYADAPERRLIASGTSIVRRPGADPDERGLNTIAVLRLNERPELQVWRRKVADDAARLANDFVSARTAAIKAMAGRQILKMCAPDGEYSLVARSVFLALLPPTSSAGFR